MKRLAWKILLSISLSQIGALHSEALGEGRYFLSRLSLQHREHKGMGYDQGYSTAALFVCPKSGILGLPFVDGRVHVFNNEDVAANLGLGARFSDAGQSYLVGFNAYYDYRNVKWLSTHQLGAGMEILSRSVDLRVNAYYPFSGKYQDDPIRFQSFKGNSLFVKQKVRYALPCADAELGWTLPEPFDQVGLYLGVGCYYLFKQRGFNHTVGNVPGVRARLTASPSSYLSFGAEYTYDKLFRGRANGFIALNIPLGRNRAGTLSTRSRQMQQPGWIAVQTQSVVRNEIIPVARKTHTFCHLQSSGKPLHFVFVNNQSSQEGKGTFENPYPTLAAALDSSQNSDILYVFAGDGTSRGYDEGLILKAGQVVTSSGVPVEINGVNIPALTPNDLPKLTRQSGPVIEVREIDVRLHGFQIEGRDDHAVYVEGGSLTLTDSEIIAAENFSAFKSVGSKEVQTPSILTNNLFTGRGGVDLPAVIELDHHQGVYKITQNQVIAANGQKGVVVYQPVGQAHLEGNLLIATDPSGMAIEYQLAGGVKEHSCVNNKIIQGFYGGLYIDNQGDERTVVDVQGNHFASETLGVGICYENHGKEGFLSLRNNIIIASQEGISLSDTELGKSSIEVTGNSLHSFSGVPSISSVFSGEIDVMIEENTITYTPNVVGKFSGIYSHLKGDAHAGDRLVIESNHVTMPADHSPVTIRDERASRLNEN